MQGVVGLIRSGLTTVSWYATGFAALLADVVIFVVAAVFAVVVVAVVAVVAVVVIFPLPLLPKSQSAVTKNSGEEEHPRKQLVEKGIRRVTPRRCADCWGFQGLASTTPRRHLREEGNGSGVFATSGTVHGPGRTYTPQPQQK